MTDSLTMVTASGRILPPRCTLAVRAERP